MNKTLSIIFNGLGPNSTYHTSIKACKDGDTVTLPIDEAIIAMNHGYAIEATKTAINKVTKAVAYNDRKRKEIAEKARAKKGGN